MNEQMPTADTALATSPDDDMAARMRGLPDRAVAYLLAAGPRIDRGDFVAAHQALSAALALAPEHAEVLRLAAVLNTRSGNPQEAVALLRHVLLLAPKDVLAHNDLGDALRASGDLDAAYVAWRRACELAPDSAAAWFNLGHNLDSDAHLDEARSALEHALLLAPDFTAARKTLGDTLVYSGEIERAAVEYRIALQQMPSFGEAWWSLANIKTVRFSAAEIAQMEQVEKYTAMDEQSRAALEFALAKTYEDEARYAEAFATLQRGNARMRQRREWNATAFGRHVDEVIAAFSQAIARSGDATLGHEVIFVVSLPRAGSTLTEQILASHSQVEGASELPELMQVVQEESARLRSPFPQWIGTATAADWERMGRRYLALTARWRTKKPRFTDKQPYNWLLVGAAQAMLPGARVINCRRDPLETAWSCYKQIFPGAAAFSYSFDDIAAFWKSYDRAARFWLEKYPDRVRDQVYENLLKEPEKQTRELLAFCDLAFDVACLQPHRSARHVRTASAGQVLEPMRRDTARTAFYGELLAPLRQALGISPNA